MSSGKDENMSYDSMDDKESGTLASLRRRKILKCAKVKIEQGCFILNVYKCMIVN